MKDLIEALTILLKYGDTRCPTTCEHDVMYVCVAPSSVSDADRSRLAELSFEPQDDDSFRSYRFGSC